MGSGLPVMLAIMFYPWGRTYVLIQPRVLFLLERFNVFMIVEMVGGSNHLVFSQSRSCIEVPASEALHLACSEPCNGNRLLL